MGSDPVNNPGQENALTKAGSDDLEIRRVIRKERGTTVIPYRGGSDPQPHFISTWPRSSTE